MCKRHVVFLEAIHAGVIGQRVRIDDTQTALSNFHQPVIAEFAERAADMDRCQAQRIANMFLL